MPKESKKPNRFFSKKQETAGCAYLGMKKTANSGATTFDKGDGKDENLLVEFKTVTKPQQSVTMQKEWLEKIQEEAFSRGKDIGILIFDFGTQKAADQYVVMRIQDFKNIYGNFKEECTNG